MSKFKETYMSPALHTTRDGSQYVLYGQGGETARGKCRKEVTLTV